MHKYEAYAKITYASKHLSTKFPQRGQIPR